MAFNKPSRVFCTSQTTGLGTLTLIPPSSGARSFQAYAGAGPEPVFYWIQGQDYFEHGRGVFTAPTTLTRVEVFLSSNANALVALPAATHDVWVADVDGFFVETVAGAHTIDEGDYGSVKKYTGAGGHTITMPDGANLCDGWMIYIRHGGTGVLTVARAGTTTIEGATSISMNPGEGFGLYLDGGVFRLFPFGYNAFTNVTLYGVTTLPGGGQIDASGNIGLGAAASVMSIRAEKSTNNSVFNGGSTHASFDQECIHLWANRAAHAAYKFIRCNSGTAAGLGGDTEFSVDGTGQIFADQAAISSPADTAWMMEWADGNPNAEDRVGLSVVVEGGKIREALPGEEPIGAVTGRAALLCNAGDLRWSGKFLRDEFNRPIEESFEVVSWEEDRLVAPAREAVVDSRGNEILPASDALTAKVVMSFAVDEIPEGVTVPAGSAVLQQLTRRKVSPEFDAGKPYIPRRQRKEWSPIGLTGMLRLRNGVPTGVRWVKMRDVAEGVEEWLVR